MTLKKSLICFIALFALLLFIEWPGSWLFDPDEARYAEIPLAMFTTGDFLTPKLNGSAYFEKPPLLYWLNALSMRALGATPYAARLPTRLATLGTAFLLLFFLKKRESLENAWATMVYLSSLLPFVLGRINITDALLTFGTTLALLSLYVYVLRDVGNKNALWGVGLGTAVAVLAKGLIGVVLPGLFVVIWAGTTRRSRLLFEVLFSRAAIVGIVLTVPWFVLMEVRNPGFSRFFFVQEHLLRYTTTEANRQGPLFYFVPVFLLGFMPWTGYFFKSLSSGSNHRDETFFFGLWCAIVFIFFSISKSKLIPYLLPVFPAAAVLTAIYLNKRGFLPRFLGIWAGVFGVLIVATPMVARQHSFHDIAEKAAKLESDHVVAYDTFLHSLPLIAGKPVPVVGYKGELASIGPMAPTLFWSKDEFWTRWDSSQRITAIFRKESLPEFERSPHNFFLLAQDRKYVLASNFKPPV